jgi:hypothetical protein
MGRGHLSKSWQEKYENHLGHETNDVQRKAASWTKNVTLACWRYSEDIWSSRNAAVHGNNTRMVSEKELTNLRRAAKDYYHSFEKDRYIVPQSRAFLFEKPLLLAQQLPWDKLAGWIASVREAILTCESRESESLSHSSKILMNFLTRSKPPNTQQPVNHPRQNHRSPLKVILNTGSPPSLSTSLSPTESAPLISSHARQRQIPPVSVKSSIVPSKLVQIQQASGTKPKGAVKLQWNYREDGLGTIRAKLRRWEPMLYRLQGRGQTPK